MKIIAEGAESQILKLNEETLKKIRHAKTYRLEFIDNKIRKFRNRREFKILNKLQELKISAPKPLEITETKKEISFTMEYVKGNSLKKVINSELLNKAFEEIIKLHNSDIVHGDLTTLNIIEKNNEIYLIDFGLSEFSSRPEEKGVDLNLFFTCIKNEHPNFFTEKNNLLKTYKKKANDGDKIIEKLKQIELRGRNKK
ncbi:MAG: Kae1-associated serine/threonine protein kinase [Nanoarchaeota archaeon]|nr:Kae1-associated serine/threonine protein kinase [Nanoarchaeota archaeon]